MTKKFSHLLLAAFVLVASGDLSQAGPSLSDFRVEIVKEASQVKLGVGDYRVLDEDAKKGHNLSWGMAQHFLVKKGRIVIGKRLFGKKILLIPLNQAKGVQVEGKLYRGKIQIKIVNGTQLKAINVLSPDDYVRGILPRETGPNWPAEALNAQAVMSRTYALRNRGKHGKNGFDFCATTHCQVYGGKSYENDAANRAVKKTKGEVILYKGEIISAVFHSTCGGATENAGLVWEGSDAPYLQSVKCRWCKASPRYKWKTALSLNRIAKRLKDKGYAVGRIKAIAAVSRSSSKRVKKVRVIGTKMKREMTSNRFRLLVGADLLRSTLWTRSAIKKGKWKVAGRGWGHGAGVCQWGAKAMAESGRGYKKIIRYYYKGTQIKSL